MGSRSPRSPLRSPGVAQPPDPVGWIDRVAFVCLPTALLLAQGAVVTSFGLALATWMRRVGRAIAVSVAGYAIIAFGWLVALELGIVPGILSWLGFVGQDDHDAWQFFRMIEASICPLGAQLAPFLSVNWAAALSRYAFYIGHVIVLLFTIGVAFLFLGLTLATFNRSMGRMPERPRRAPAAATAQAARAARTRSRVARACSGWGQRLIQFVGSRSQLYSIPRTVSSTTSGPQAGPPRNRPYTLASTVPRQDRVRLGGCHHDTVAH